MRLKHFYGGYWQWSMLLHCTKQATRQWTSAGNLQTSSIKTNLALFAILLGFVVTSVLTAYLGTFLVFFHTCFFSSLNITNTFLLLAVIQTTKNSPKWKPTDRSLKTYTGVRWLGICVKHEDHISTTTLFLQKEKQVWIHGKLIMLLGSLIIQ